MIIIDTFGPAPTSGKGGGLANQSRRPIPGGLPPGLPPFIEPTHRYEQPGPPLPAWVQLLRLTRATEPAVQA